MESPSFVVIGGNHMADLIQRLLENASPEVDNFESELFTEAEVSFFRGIGILGKDS